MKAYRFSLETVMRIRALEERIARDKLMIAQRNLRHRQDECTKVETELRGLCVPSGPMTIDEVRWIGEKAGRLSEDICIRRDAMQVALHARENAAISWHSSRKRLGALERLDAAGLARWKEEASHQEVTELDDIANARHLLSGARS